MRKITLLCALFIAAQVTTAVGQYVNVDTTHIPSASFVRLFPFELMAREFRLGFEVATAPRQAFVIDGSYFWGTTLPGESNNKSGWAVKMDYRYYNRDISSGSRFFFGPNIMLKQQQISSRSSYVTDTRTVFSGNLKMGFDVRLGSEAHSRLELFTGAGLRYQSIGTDLSLSGKGSVNPNEGSILPNALLGIVLKL